MAANVSDLIEEVKAMLMGGYRPTLNWLAVAPDTDDTTLTLADELKGLTSGGYISIDDEIMYVRSTTPAGKTALVRRGLLGTTPAAHLVDAEVEVNPRFAKPLIRRELQKEIRSWPNRLYRPETLDLSVSLDVRGYDLTGTDANLIGVAAVEVAPESLAGNTSKAWIRPRFRLSRMGLTTDFASGNALTFESNLGHLSGNRAVRVTLALPFVTDVFTDATTLVDIGLDDSQQDIPVIGASWRLMAAREVQRSFQEAQGQSRDAQEVPPRTAVTAAQYLKSQRDARIGEEIERLLDRFPLLET